MKKDNFKKTGVIYTCITNGYDPFINHKYIDSNWDYVCFTDNLNIVGNKNSTWEVRPLIFNELDDIKNQRWHKLHPHILFPEYEKSIWVDANVNILKDGFFGDIKKAINEDELMSIAPHPIRNCIYDELDACIDMGKDNIEIMKKQIELVKKNNFPKGVGLFETNIIYRKHLNPLVISVMDDWWWWIKNYSRRDQLSLNYVLWKKKMQIEPLSKVTYRDSDKVNFTYGENHVTKEELIKQKNDLILTIEQKNREVNSLYQIIKQKEEEIIFMKSSKFWKLRDKYLKIRNYGK
ncbi:MAG TPA: hypothetical protein DDY21_01215 [Candidatus Moranbacteria bacterium]|nr:hypothetical protein [Candidatus Moranbacteria bacterium]HCO99440.1 hypothetical protein [Candidatus Moranbacteria bacterium]